MGGVRNNQYLAVFFLFCNALLLEPKFFILIVVFFHLTRQKFWGSPHQHCCFFFFFLSPAVARGLRSSPWILPPWSKHTPINRAEGDAGQQQNDRHLYYKPQTLCSRGPVLLSHTTPSKPHIPMSKPLGAVSSGGPQCDPSYLSSLFCKTGH